MVYFLRLLTVDIVGTDYRAFIYVEFDTYTIKGTDFSSLIVGYKNDFTGLYLIRSSTKGIIH